MNWPAWTDILPTVALVLGLAGSVVGMFYVLMKLFRPAAEKAAREATDRLYDRLKGNDFAHLEAQMDTRFGAVDRRFEAVDKRFDGIDKRLDRIDRRVREGIEAGKADRREMEKRLMAAIGAISEAA